MSPTAEVTPDVVQVEPSSTPPDVAVQPAAPAMDEPNLPSPPAVAPPPPPPGPRSTDELFSVLGEFQAFMQRAAVAQTSAANAEDNVLDVVPALYGYLTSAGFEARILATRGYLRRLEDVGPLLAKAIQLRGAPITAHNLVHLAVEVNNEVVVDLCYPRLGSAGRQTNNVLNYNYKSDWRVVMCPPVEYCTPNGTFYSWLAENMPPDDAPSEEITKAYEGMPSVSSTNLIAAVCSGGVKRKRRKYGQPTKLTVRL